MKTIIYILPLLISVGCSKQPEAYAAADTAPSTTTAATKELPTVRTVVPTTPAPSAVPAPSAPTPNPEPATTTERSPDGDVALTKAVREALEREANVRDVDIRVTDGDVLLTGSVSTPVQKDAAGVAAKNVPGVRTVDNQLMVKGS